jgi:hypothetical protein
MPISDQMPGPAQLTGILSGLIGDSGSGLSGAGQILATQDFSQLSTGLVQTLGGLIGV